MTPPLILIVEDEAPQAEMLRYNLEKAGFRIQLAADGEAALQRIDLEIPDLALVDWMMPERSGIEVCRILRARPETAKLPIIMLTARGEEGDRVLGLEAGADDFLTKPVNDIALFARVRSLIRLKIMMDELRLRETTSSNFGVSDAETLDVDISGGRILVVEDREIYARNINQALEGQHTVIMATDGDSATAAAQSESVDLIIISLSLQGTDGLRLCSHLRSMEESRQVPILILVDDIPDQIELLVKGLDLGVNDYLIRPVDQNELMAR
ncbi:MAG: response regulator, partial [Rhodospirillales bacterium]|nr:response regulator [Rhodospirillales bacterium]